MKQYALDKHTAKNRETTPPDLILPPFSSSHSWPPCQSTQSKLPEQQFHYQSGNEMDGEIIKEAAKCPVLGLVGWHHHQENRTEALDCNAKSPSRVASLCFSKQMWVWTLFCCVPILLKFNYEGRLYVDTIRWFFFFFFFSVHAAVNGAFMSLLWPASQPAVRQQSTEEQSTLDVVTGELSFRGSELSWASIEPKVRGFDGCSMGFSSRFNSSEVKSGWNGHRRNQITTATSFNRINWTKMFIVFRPPTTDQKQQGIWLGIRLFNRPHRRRRLPESTRGDSGLLYTWGLTIKEPSTISSDTSR